MPGRRIQHEPMMGKTGRGPKAERDSNSNILLTQPVRLRNEKIKTVPDLALSVTRWQAGMNAKMMELGNFKEETREALELLMDMAKKNEINQWNHMRCSMGLSFENTRLSGMSTESPLYSDVIGPGKSGPIPGPHDMSEQKANAWDVGPAHGPYDISEQKAKAWDLKPVDISLDAHEQKTKALTPEQNSRHIGGSIDTRTEF
eukprot:FR739748.1.p1 GENE.FR739748.1~~FR739748.1.p1  ORF type:complete len:214 (+),score=9.53 FR739748.1:38-643(+)